MLRRTLVRQRPFTNDLYKEVLDADDVRALRILNFRLESFFPFYICPLRRHFRKQLRGNNAGWRDLPGTTKLFDVSVPSKIFQWTVPIIDHGHPDPYLESRVIVEFHTKGVKYIETVDTMYYDGKKELTPSKNDEKIIVYFPREDVRHTPEDKSVPPYAIAGRAVTVPLRYGSIVATVGGQKFWDILRDAKSAWRRMDQFAREQYNYHEIIPHISNELNIFMMKKIPEYMKEAKKFFGTDSRLLRLCLKHLQKEIQTYLDKVDLNDHNYKLRYRRKDCSALLSGDFKTNSDG